MKEYKIRLVKIIQYIDENLDTELSLETVSEVGSYSPFHFHRIFKMITGETLQQYISRKRTEKSAFYLSLRKNVPVKDIYLNLGFSSHSGFNKTFKKYYGKSPTEFRKASPEKFQTVSRIQSNNGQVDTVFASYLCNMENLIYWTAVNLKIKVTQLPEMNLAAVMSLGTANVETSFNILIDWAEERKLFPQEDLKMISVYHDSFKVTAADKVRIHACMLLNEPMKKQEGEVFPEILEGGKFIVGSGELTLAEFEQSWVSLFLWMKENNYSTRKAFPFEIYHSDFKEHPEGKMIVDFCIPIQ